MVAGKVYRPVTYTFVLVNDKAHNGMRHYVSITQYPSKYTEYNDGGNVFVNGYYARLVPDAGYSSGDLPQTATPFTSDGTVYRSYNFILDNYTSAQSAYYNTTSAPTVGNAPFNYGAGTAITSGLSPLLTIATSYEYVRGTINSGTTSVTFPQTIDVHVSAFTADDNSFTVTEDGQKKTYEYAIGDPRILGSYVKDPHTTSTTYAYDNNFLYDYLNRSAKENASSSGRPGGASYNYYRYVTSWGENAAKIKIGGTSTGYDPVIAPLFKIQSSYGAAGYQVFFQVAQKRCATYQEAGYPAGRWRLPTLAEIAFIVRLQNDGVIKKMFNSGSAGYWTSSGGRIVADDDMTYSPHTSGSACYVRCVYDLWKWQDGQQKPTHNYYVKPE
jgi:hypothetical protein